MKKFVQNHPIISYICATMVWSWGFWSLLFTVIRPGELLSNPPPIAFLYVVLGGIGPSVVGVVLTIVIEGKKGITNLTARLKSWRFGYWWSALLFIPLLTAVTPLLRYIAGYPVSLSSMGKLILPGIALGLTAGVMEEFGWRGFLLPHLLKRYNPYVATLLLGLIWGGLWHGYADFFGVKNTGVYYIPILLLLGPGLLTAWSFVLTKVYKATKGSLLFSILVHASISSSALIFGQTYSSSSEEFVWTGISVLIAFTGALTFFFWNQKKGAKR